MDTGAPVANGVRQLLAPGAIRFDVRPGKADWHLKGALMGTMSALRRWCRPILGAAVVLWFWYAYSSHTRLKQAAGIALATTQRPYVLAGLHINLDRYLTPQFRPEPGVGYYLVFVSSDSCRHSEEQAAVLLRWLRRANVVPATVLISFDEGSKLQPPLVSALQERKVPFQRLKIQNQAAFSEDTGLAWTPAILIVDSGLRVRLVTEHLSASAEERIAELLNQGGRRDPTR